MSNRLVSFTVDHPQLEYLPHESGLGRKKAQVWKNQGSPGLMLGSINLYSPTNSPRGSPRSPPIRFTPSRLSESPTIAISYQDSNFSSLVSQFPRFTKAHPKVVVTCPIVEPTINRRRMGDLATHILTNRKSIG